MEYKIINGRLHCQGAKSATLYPADCPRKLQRSGEFGDCDIFCSHYEQVDEYSVKLWCCGRVIEAEGRPK